MRRRLLARVVVAVVAAGLVLAYGLGRLKLNRLKGPLRAAVEQSLKREVEFRGPVRLSLWGRPALAVEDVIIHDDPQISLEPLAYAAELRVHWAWSRLVRGKLAVSEVVLEEPSINLVKLPDGRWNYLALLKEISESSRKVALGGLHVRRGRINFRAGLRKSPFYFGDVDLDVEPEDPQSLWVQFAGEPARTDRPVRRFGRLRIQGRWSRRDPVEKLNLTVSLQGTAISELLNFLTNRRWDLGGFLSLRARLEGSPAQLRLGGELRLEDIDFGPLLFPVGRAQWTLPLNGEWDLEDQSLRLRIGNDSREQSLQVQLVGTGLGRSPEWAVLGLLRRFPAGHLQVAAARAGWKLPGGLRVRGVVSGAVSWLGGTKLDGSLLWEEGGLEGSSSGRVELGRALVVLRGTSWALDSEGVRLGQGQAEINGVFHPWERQMTLEIVSHDWPVKEFAQLWATFHPGKPLTGFSWFDGGQWQGRLELVARAGVPVEIQGQAELKDARCANEFVPPGVLLQQATLRIAQSEARLHVRQGKLGSVGFRADYRAELHGPELSRWLDVDVDRADIGLVRTLASGWLEKRAPQVAGMLRGPQGSAGGPASLLRGRIVIDSVSTRWGEFGPVSCSYRWSAAQLELRSCQARLEGANIGGGEAVVRWKPRGCHGRFWAPGIPWAGGHLGLSGEFHTRGLRWTELSRAGASGRFWGFGLRVGDDRWRWVQGRFRTTAGRIELSGLEVASAEMGSLYGSGSVGENGEIELRLFNGIDKYEARGQLKPLRIDLTAVPASSSR